MMMMFYVPGSLWRKMNRSSGINTKMITKILADMDQLDDEKRKDSMDSLVKLINHGLTYHQDYYHGFMYV